MPGYLDQYGVGEERREKIIRTVIIALVAVVIIGGIAYFFLKDYRQENQVKTFFRLLEKHDYQGAYALWGCTDAHPCRDYPMQSFLQDWGPQSAHADLSSARVAKSRSCGSGVIITVDYDKKSGKEDKLWVERDSLILGFSPWPGCPPGQ
jgi:hypothetical protein